MPKDKDRAMNPAMAQRKLEKQKTLKKGKAEAVARRNEKLARRNPERIQRQITDLKAVEESGQPLRPRDKQILEALERDLRAVLKAREALGEKAPKFSSGGGGGGDGDGILGKRRREGNDRRHQKQYDSASSDTDESVRRIPMPRDTPPPIPRQQQRRGRGPQRQQQGEEGQRGEHALPARPAVEAKTVYEAAPAIRNLRQEAVSKFVPAAVRMKQEAIRGQGKLLEPEEMDRLEQAGYSASTAADHGQQVTASHDDDNDADHEQRLQEEENRFHRELRTVQIEEVEDEEA
ncbi:hypothetical protein ASPZODRAFT_1211700 [Penicilliopsis zonata CBS 506.65]|uniref:Wbp11/ELF5/Saf1 N-terminal domain-containing protein n=1 Tax=Penicilliopsis zonata CBS 506.65 TaxID=1073090 RepID=A0A1L9S7D5_9EURO|nr:hypothetical protein ASPZODRAFT_1211700 [Penicilliopsis zonata CBS 506.65]OJJ43077.1 hypothetical protein ASPZODRAFT_1211700 [Penicilliopsis zonata CBS 506.65]